MCCVGYKHIGQILIYSESNIRHLIKHWRWTNTPFGNYCIKCAKYTINTRYYVIYLHITSHRIASYRIASHRIASHRIASHRIASHRFASLRFASHHITSHHITSHRIAFYRIVTYIISFIISYHLFSFCKSVQDYIIHMDLEIIIFVGIKGWHQQKCVQQSHGYLV